MIFLSTPSARRATHGRRDNLCSGQISIHALCEEGDDHRRPAAHVRQISIHALCEEGDGSSRRMPAASFDFYPRPLRGGRHTALSPPASPMIFLSTPSARRATSSKEDEIMVEWKFLSTPSARRATRTSCTRSLPMRFLSTPSARRATYRYATYKATAIFLSTPSARRATRASSSRRCHSMYFYPRPPRGGRPAPYAAIRWLEDISIHALREEGD